MWAMSFGKPEAQSETERIVGNGTTHGLKFCDVVSSSSGVKRSTDVVHELPESVFAIDKVVEIAGVTDKLPAFNKHLLWAAQQYEGKSIYEAPEWADEKLQYIPAHLGCASTVCNLIRLAMKHDKLIDWKDNQSHRELFQINVDKLLPILEGPPYNAKRISAKDAVAGDIVVGLGPGPIEGHIGVVGNVENGRRQVYDNVSGTLLKESLTDRFSKYETLFFLRLNFDAKQGAST